MEPTIKFFHVIRANSHMCMWEFARMTCENLIVLLERHVGICSSKFSHMWDMWELDVIVVGSSFARVVIPFEQIGHLSKFSQSLWEFAQMSSFVDRHLLEWSFDSSKLVIRASSHKKILTNFVRICENFSQTLSEFVRTLKILTNFVRICENFVRICSNDQFARMTIKKRSQNDRTNKHRTLFCRALVQKRPIICLGNFDLHPHTHNTRDVWADQLENRLRWSNSQKLALLLSNRDCIVIESWWYIVSFTGIFCKRDLLESWEFPKVGSVGIESWLWSYWIVMIYSFFYRALLQKRPVWELGIPKSWLCWYWIVII